MMIEIIENNSAVGVIVTAQGFSTSPPATISYVAGRTCSHSSASGTTNPAKGTTKIGRGARTTDAVSAGGSDPNTGTGVMNSGPGAIPSVARIVPWTMRPIENRP